MFNRLMGLSLVAVTFSGCGTLDATKEKKDESFRYQFSENGCDTGEQVFASKEAYCAALKNDSLNHGCAPRTRLELASKECT